MPSSPVAAAGATGQALCPHSFVSQTGVQSPISRWDPYRNARPGSTISSGIGWTGEWGDPTGLVELRARAYDPLTARFTSRDTFAGLAAAPQSANRYAYALNGPYRYRIGRCADALCLGSRGPGAVALRHRAAP